MAADARRARRRRALLHWRNVTPFGIESSAQFRSIAPPALDSGAYVKDFDEVKTVGFEDERGQAEPTAPTWSEFYNVVLAVGTWNPVARQLAAAQRSSLSENAAPLRC